MRFSFGLLSTILDGYSLDEVIDFSSKRGFQCVELACWPSGTAERRYSGVNHFDVVAITDAQADNIRRKFEKNHLRISALAYYPNPLSPDLTARAEAIEHIHHLISWAHKLGTDTVTTFIGRDKDKNVDENFEVFRTVWPGIVAHAEAQNVRIAIENCPMYFSNDEWPGGLNLASSPALWSRMFTEIDSPYFGLNYDPSHLYLQNMDYIKPLYTFQDKIFHVHFKDIKIHRDRLDEYGIFAPPLRYISTKLPGLGDIHWADFITALYDIQYTGSAVIEIEDKSFEQNAQSVIDAIDLSSRILHNYIV